MIDKTWFLMEWAGAILIVSIGCPLLVLFCVMFGTWGYLKARYSFNRRYNLKEKVNGN